MVELNGKAPTPQVNGGAAPPKEAEVPAQGAGTVFEVRSGDTIVVCTGTLPSGELNLRQITLAGVQAPRLGLKTTSVNSADENWAWESKEFLRTWLLNKQVSFGLFVVGSLKDIFGNGGRFSAVIFAT